MSVKVFGELEFWFSFFKVATIIIMILAGFGIIIWGIGNGGQPTGIHNLWSNGGFFSNGWLGMVMSLQMVMFAYGGIEIIGITAGEAEDPEKSIPRAINSVPMRILVFYVGTLFVIMSIYPWNQVGTNGSPFVLTFQHMGIAFAASILNFVVLTASLSAINSDVFGVGRMLHGMAEQGSAPKMFAKTSRRGVPWVTVMVMTIALLFAVYLNYIMPENVFLVIASLATFATVWVWIMILLSQIAFRRRLPPEEAWALKFKVPGGVATTAVGLAFLVFIIALIGYHPDTRISLYVGFALDSAAAGWLEAENSPRPSAGAGPLGGPLACRICARYPAGYWRFSDILLRSPPPIILPMMSHTPERCGKVCPFCTERNNDVEGMAPACCPVYQGAAGTTLYHPMGQRR
ncbi:Proline-specific permease ProY [Raoultella terrigena]|uniref:Proline-specific permease ProY n=1 Tax=Raoultella terrigena TaxID=577 RepID=A0A485B1Z1_RAOTE|nr:Proline-specific permease ProY [Raoultella terrigena]